MMQISGLQYLKFWGGTADRNNQKKDVSDPMKNRLRKLITRTDYHFRGS